MTLSTASTVSTTTDLLFQRWAIDDEVTALRMWGSGTTHPLRPGHPVPIAIGTASHCMIRVEDPSNRTSRVHAYLEHMREHGRWCIVDQSKNGLLIDGDRRAKCLLSPGMEIELGGGVIMIAESARLGLLREALARMLGWSAESAAAGDRALRMIRLAAMRRAILVLCGDYDVAPLAEDLHRLTLTTARPFVLCNPRRRASEGEGEEGFTKSAPNGMAAVAQADGGTVCIYDDRRCPRDVLELLRALRQPTCRAQLVVCAKNADKAAIFNPAPVVIPPLSARKAELERIIDGYAADAAARLRFPKPTLAPIEIAWIRERSSATLPEIQTATLRLAAIRHARTVSGGAALLGLSHVTMLQWLQSRRFHEALRRHLALR